MQIITKQQTLSLIDFPGLIESAGKAYSIHSSTKQQSYYINLPIGTDFAHFKAGYIPDSKYFVLKYSGGFWTYGSFDNGYVIVHDSKTGQALFMFEDDGAITNYRTAAAGAFTSKLLSRKDSHRVGLIGTGIQARLQIEALTFVRDIDTVKVWGRTEKNLVKYINEMKAKFPNIKFIKCQIPKEVTQDIDILITTTYSDKPIIKSDWLSDSMHIVAVGACGPNMQEFEENVFNKVDKTFIDSIEKASLDGELHHALEKGMFNLQELTGEIGDVINGKAKGRKSDNEITFVDLVGLGIQDATAAEYLLGKI